MLHTETSTAPNQKLGGTFSRRISNCLPYCYLRPIHGTCKVKPIIRPNSAAINPMFSIFQVEKLSSVFLSPNQPEQFHHNAIQVIKALKLLHIDVDLRVEDIFNPCAIKNLLVIVRLYKSLPGYRVRSDICCSGKNGI